MTMDSDNPRPLSKSLEEHDAQDWDHDENIRVAERERCAKIVDDLLFRSPSREARGALRAAADRIRITEDRITQLERRINNIRRLSIRLLADAEGLEKQLSKLRRKAEKTQ